MTPVIGTEEFLPPTNPADAARKVNYSLNLEPITFPCPHLPYFYGKREILDCQKSPEPSRYEMFAYFFI